MFKLGKPVSYSRVLVYGGEDITVTIGTMPPNRTVSESLTKVYAEFNLKEGTEIPVEFIDKLNAVLTPAIVAAHVKTWDIADAEGAALPCTKENVLAVFEDYPAIFAIAIEALYNAIPQRREELKN